VAEIRIVPATQDDVDYIANHLRLRDLEELRASHGNDVDAVQLLRLSVSLSEEAMVAVTAHGEPVAVFGVVPLSILTGDGRPWMLATDMACRFRRELVIGGRHWTSVWGERYEALSNWVDARNTPAIRWLERIGYRIHDAVPYGPNGLPFHPFDRYA
jgi:ribosomal protein S18 acetylase RimI-like enzyme